MKAREQFASKTGFILAAAGSAVGLGAIWKFPYMAGSNGGSVFIILFILCVLLISLPVLVAEFMIGRRGQKDAVTTFKEQAPGTPWYWIGRLGTVMAILILSFYSVVGGWIISYLWRSIRLSLTLSERSAYENLFQSIIANPIEVLATQALFLGITVWIVQAGIKSGIEKAGNIMMPALFIFFIVLVLRAVTLEGAYEGIRFMFIPDWSELSWDTLLLALGQAFFTLSVGVSVMITYASYLGKKERIGGAALSVAIMNILISILAGLVIFPSVFALGFQPDEGPGLVFVILPAVFEQIPYGYLFMIVFFVLLLFATITSSISLLEIIVSVVIGNRRKNRSRIAWLSALFIFIIGIPSALSFGVWSDFKIAHLSFFDAIDFLTNRIGMPLGALFISLFAGYYYKKEISKEELATHPALYYTWLTLVRVISPIAIVIILIQGIRAM